MSRPIWQIFVVDDFHIIPFCSHNFRENRRSEGLWHFENKEELDKFYIYSTPFAILLELRRIWAIWNEYF